MEYLLALAPQLAAVADKYGHLPIHYTRTVREFRLFSDHSNVLEATNNVGLSTLSILVKNRRIKYTYDTIVILKDVLVRCPSLIYQIDVFGNTPSHHVANCYDGNDTTVLQFEILRTLPEYGCDVNSRNMHGQTPLLLCHNVPVVMAYLKLEGRIDDKDAR